MFSWLKKKHRFISIWKMEKDRLLDNDLEGERKKSCLQRMSRNSWIALGAIGLAVAIVIVVTAVLLVVYENSDDDDDDHNGHSSSAVSSLVTVSAIMKHLQQFEAIANAPGNGGSRSVSSPGYEQSAQYVIDELNKSGGFSVERQYFMAPVFTQHSNPTLALVSPVDVQFALGIDFQQPRYGGNGSIELQADVASVGAFGCSDADWSEFPRGHAALVQGGGECNYYAKALHATDAGASALLVSSSVLTNTRVRATEWTTQSANVQIPVLSVTSTVAATLKAAAPSTVKLSIDSTFSVHSTFNVIATLQSSGGGGAASEAQPPLVVMSGSHLDSVQAGPGYVVSTTSQTNRHASLLTRVAKQQHQRQWKWLGAQLANGIGICQTQIEDDESIDSSVVG
jgi:PA domain